MTDALFDLIFIIQSVSLSVLHLVLIILALKYIRK